MNQGTEEEEHVWGLELLSPHVDMLGLRYLCLDVCWGKTQKAVFNMYPNVGISALSEKTDP